MDDISPQMALAVMAAEDQKFPDHWGFDVAAIEKALSHNEAPDAHPRRVHAVAAKPPRTCFCGMAAAGCAKGWRPD